MLNSALFRNVPPLYIVAFTILVLCMSFMSFVFYCFRVYFALKEIEKYND